MTRGASVSVSNLFVKYGSFVALGGVSLDVKAGEFLALLGPSGSGKSTILMTIAGFNRPTSGEVSVDGASITRIPIFRRNIGMVFQKYALFPHMTVFENVAYPLRRRGMQDGLIKKQVRDALELVRLDQYESRYPAELSGGQQQRVALSRALVFQPPVLLMDEPLGALDRKLRQQLQMEIKRIHRTVGTTIIFVTHDQEEALSMADRVAVMEAGEIIQVGTPSDLYDRPNSRFVADFMSEVTFINVAVTNVEADKATIRIPGLRGDGVVVSQNGLSGRETAAVLAVRPECFVLSDNSTGMRLSVLETAYAGDTIMVLASSEQGEIKVKLPISSATEKLGHGDHFFVVPDYVKCRVFP